ncbi:MAG: hypothetical protein EBT92_17600 [Planctomycetes bacterium]|nr:hypothetical protein [Planctomycetota bacterium]
MNINEIRLELLDMADDLDGCVIDNGPMGEYQPHADKARRLRSLARELKEVTGNSGNERRKCGPHADFRDIPWPTR